MDELVFVVVLLGIAEGGTEFEAITAQDYLMERLREIGLVKA